MGDAITKPGVGTTALAAGVRIDSVPEVFRLAEALSQARGFIPSGLVGNVGGIAAAILTGIELGIGPMEAMRSIHIVEGKPTLSAEMMLARAIRAGIRHTWLRNDAEEAHLRLERAGFAPYEQRWTIADARAANLAGKGNWAKYAPSMLRARCVSAAMRAYCPDVLGAGVYVHGELDGAALDAPSEAVSQASSGSPEVRILSDALHEVDPDTEEPDSPEMERAMQQLATCKTDSDFRAWVRANGHVIEQEKLTERKAERWKRIGAVCRRLTPPVRADEAKRIFAEARTQRAAPRVETVDPLVRVMDELASVEAVDGMRAWADDAASVLAGIEQGSPVEHEVWSVIRARCELVGCDPMEVESRIA